MRDDHFTLEYYIKLYLLNQLDWFIFFLKTICIYFFLSNCRMQFVLLSYDRLLFMHEIISNEVRTQYEIKY